jgi:hypothetical protein
MSKCSLVFLPGKGICYISEELVPPRVCTFCLLEAHLSFRASLRLFDTLDFQSFARMCTVRWKVERLCIVGVSSSECCFVDATAGCEALTSLAGAIFEI